MPSYRVEADRPTIIRGDTMDGFKLTLKKKESQEVIAISSVCMQMRDEYDKLVHDFQLTQDDQGYVLIHPVPAETTSAWAAGEYKYSVRFRLGTGRVRTYLSGMITIEEDVARC